MDGYTFMLARNRLLIDAAVARQAEPLPAPAAAAGAPRSEEDPIDRQLRDQVLEVYRRLEGCGR
jgi:hypothetical protein